MRNNADGKFMSSVKVGAKGQIVIPKEARDLFNIKPGDTLLLLADVNRGIAINRLDYFDKIANEIFNGKANEQKDDKIYSDSDRFANEVKKIKHKEEE